ncbi:MAG: oligosaccharide flippase family protein, partial [Clostridia bacterium]|nr:oligosaccharide flippase family protein [Clostridia bacterium]
MKPSQPSSKRQSFLGGAFILVLATVIVKIIGAIYKFPLLNILTTQGTGYYNTAYSIYLPVYVLATAGLPAAVARMVSEQYSKKHYANIRKLLSVTLTCFLVTGTLGSLAVFFAPDIIPESWNLFDPQAKLAIKALAPTVFFVCLMSAHRGYNEGLRNMVPTASSQVLEAVCKLVVGLGCSHMAISYGMNAYENGQPIFGQLCSTEQQAMDVILPVAAACGIIGVTLGAMLGMIFLFARHKFRGDGITPEMLAASPEPERKKVLFKKLFKIALPIAVGAIALNLSSMIDNFTINNRIKTLTETVPEFVLSHFAPLFSADGVLTSLDRLPNYLWGL